MGLKQNEGDLISKLLRLKYY